MISRSFPTWNLAPVLALVGLVFLIPFGYLLWLSFTDFSLAAAQNSGTVVGFANYRRALSGDSLFLGSLLRSAVFAGLCVVPQLSLALLAAEGLHASLLARRILSPFLILPVLMPPVVVGLYWRVLLQGEFGAGAYYLAALGLPGARGLLSSTDTILVTLAVVDFWQWFPFVLLVLLAVRIGLTNAPIEAAWIDGASRLRAFLEIALPAMLPAVFLIGLLRAIDSFKEFDKVYVMTGGGPGLASELVSIHIWRTAFKQWEFGYAAALSVIVYLVILVATQLLLRFRAVRLFA